MFKIISIVTSLLIPYIFTQELDLCQDVVDERFGRDRGMIDFNLSVIINRHQIDIPQGLMSTGKKRTFGLMNRSHPLRCGNKGIRITLPLTRSDKYDNFKVNPLNNGTYPSDIKNNNSDSSGIGFHNIGNATIVREERKVKPPKPVQVRVRGKVETHFTPQGYLEHDHFIYGPNQFCISRITKDDIELNLCPPSCSDGDTTCIPKCCGFGQVLRYWKWTCETAPTPQNQWTPFIYDNTGSVLETHDVDPSSIYYHRPYLNCTREITPYKTVVRPKDPTKDPDKGIPFRLTRSGQILLLHQDRTWKPMTTEGSTYCIDGFSEWKGLETYPYKQGDEKGQMVILCVNDTLEDPEGTVSRNNRVNTTNNARINNIYAGVLYAAGVFIFTTGFINGILYDGQSPQALHRLTIVSQCVSLFFFYVSHGTAYLISHRRDAEHDERSWSCLGLAILSHFFFLTTFSWLTVFNFDLWLTFRSLRPISKMSKKMRRFRLYSLIGWGIPLFMMVIFVTINEVYKDPVTLVRTPDYAITSCYVAGWARKPYICSILSAVIPINLLLIVSTFKIFYEFKKGKSGAVMPKKAKGDKYSFKLFIKLFLVMGTVWVFEAIFCWFFNTGEQPPWLVTVVDCLTFLQAVAIFIIFCGNKRTLKQLEEQYPAFKAAFAPIKKALHIPEPSGTEGTETTAPNTPAGSRKMSTISSSSVSMTMMESGGSSAFDTLQKKRKASLPNTNQ